jgi:hypothetical protein
MEPRLNLTKRATPSTPVEEPQLNLKTLIAPRQVASVKLPSRGVFYDPSLTKEGSVEITPWVGRDVKLLAGMTGNNIDEVIDILVGRCLISKIPLSEMITTDRFFLLVMLRANSFGEAYKITTSCGICGKTGIYELKLPSDYEIEYTEDGAVEPFTIELPESKIKVSYRLPRGKDDKAAKEYIEREYKKNPAAIGEVGLTFRVANLITAFNGEKVTAVEALPIVDNLPAKDFYALQAAFEKSLPGIVPRTTKTCVNCQAAMEVGLPIQAEFFRYQP